MLLTAAPHQTYTRTSRSGDSIGQRRAGAENSPELPEVGVPQRLPRRQSLVGVIDEQLLYQVYTLRVQVGYQFCKPTAILQAASQAVKCTTGECLTALPSVCSGAASSLLLMSSQVSLTCAPTCCCGRYLQAAVAAPARSSFRRL